MKLKSLKFVLPILLVLPSLAFGAVSYSRSPSGYTITSPVYISVSVDNVLSDLCYQFPYTTKWKIRIYSINDIDYWESPEKDISEKSLSYDFDLPVGTQVAVVSATCYQFPYWSDGYEFEGSSYDMHIIFEVAEAPKTISNVSSWLSQNEILGYIGKLTEDIPNYIALIIGLPISFWFIEKIIAFVRGNFRS
jgi:hypothetical protein